MDIISKLEKRFGAWAIPHLAIYLIGLQAIGVALLMGHYVDLMDLIKRANVEVIGLVTQQATSSE